MSVQGLISNRRLQKLLQRHSDSNDSSFAIKCGGPTMTTTDTEYEANNATLGPASYNVASTEKWAVSNVGRFSEGSNNRYYRYTQEEFLNTIDSGLFQYARLSPGSLRYYGLGLENGNYTVNLKFADTDFSRFTNLGKCWKMHFRYLSSDLPISEMSEGGSDPFQFSDGCSILDFGCFVDRHG